MNLPDLSPEIGALLIKLPYRVGLYISVSDKTGGGRSDEAELRALENVVTYYVEDFCKSEFAQAIMLETLRNKSDWGNWNGSIETVPDDCVRVFDALTDQLDMKDIVAFKNNLLEIANAVAMAYREFDATEPWIERFKVYLSILVERIKVMLKGDTGPTADQMLNISREEKAAINLLSQTLGIEYKVG